MAKYSDTNFLDLSRSSQELENIFLNFLNSQSPVKSRQNEALEDNLEVIKRDFELIHKQRPIREFPEDEAERNEIIYNELKDRLKVGKLGPEIDVEKFAEYWADKRVRFPETPCFEFPGEIKRIKFNPVEVANELFLRFVKDPPKKTEVILENRTPDEKISEIRTQGEEIPEIPVNRSQDEKFEPGRSGEVLEVKQNSPASEKPEVIPTRTSKILRQVLQKSEADEIIEASEPEFDQPKQPCNDFLSQLLVEPIEELESFEDEEELDEVQQLFTRKKKSVVPEISDEDFDNFLKSLSQELKLTENQVDHFKQHKPPTLSDASKKFRAKTALEFNKSKILFDIVQVEVEVQPEPTPEVVYKLPKPVQDEIPKKKIKFVDENVPKSSFIQAKPKSVNTKLANNIADINQRYKLESSSRGETSFNSTLNSSRSSLSNRIQLKSTSIKSSLPLTEIEPWRAEKFKTMKKSHNVDSYLNEFCRTMRD